jgi:hypothetical protein
VVEELADRKKEQIMHVYVVTISCDGNLTSAGLIDIFETYGGAENCVLNEIELDDADSPYKKVIRKTKSEITEVIWFNAHASFIIKKRKIKK